jgi:acyl carrier protein
MDNIEKLKSVFAAALLIDINNVSDDLEYQKIIEWDSVSHMVLISEIEFQFNISLNTDDVINLNTFKECKEILKKYNICF